MSFSDIIKKRKSVYDFENKNLKDTQINEILEAARWAPSCSNSQPWNFIIIKDKKILSKAMSSANYGDFHNDPNVIIAIVLREDLCSGEGKACFRGNALSVHDSFMSCAIAASYISLSAADIGIGSCFLTPNQEEIKKILKVNKNDAVPLIIGLGYQKNGFEKIRERRTLNESVHYEYFGGKN